MNKGIWIVIVIVLLAVAAWYFYGTPAPEASDVTGQEQMEGDAMATKDGDAAMEDGSSMEAGAGLDVQVQ